MGDLKEQLEKWKQSRYKEPMSMTRYKMSEGFEWGVQSFLKKNGISRTRFSYGNLYVPRGDVEKAKTLLKKEVEKSHGDVQIMPKAILGEEHDCKKIHPGKRHQEWLNTEPVFMAKEEMFDEGRMKDIYTMDQEGKSHKDIAKRLNLKVSTVKTILGEDVDTLQEFTDSQIASLKKDYAPLQGKTISGGNANKLMKIFDKFDKSKPLLIKLLKAKIPFVSMLAQARLISKHGANAAQLAQMRREQLDEGRWRIQGVLGYKDVSSQDRFDMVINATSKKDAENKYEKELDKYRARRTIGPGGGGSVEDIDDVEIEPTTKPISITTSMTHSYVPEAKAPFRLSYDDKYGKHAGFEDAKTLQDLQNKAQKLRSKGFKINKMGRNTSPVEQKLPEPEGKQIATEAKYHYDIKISSDYGNDGGDQEDEGTLNASSDKDAQKQADKLAEKFAELWNKRKRSVGRPGGFDPVEIDVYKEAYTVQITKTDGSKLVIGKYNTPAEAEKYIKWYKTGDMSKTKSAKVIKEDSGYLQSKMSDKQIANIKNVWKNKKATDVTDAVRQMIKRMDIPTQLAIKSADIPHISKLVEDDDKAYAIGMAKAKEIKKDFGSPLKKSTIVKAHDIAKAIKKDEQVVGVGPRATFERLWLKHKRGDKAGK